MPLAKLPYIDAVNHSRVDEAIWGHRLRHSQTGWLLLLEALNIAQGCLEFDATNPLPDMGSPNAPVIALRTRIRFRNLLFSLNQKAAELAAAVENGRIASDTAWDTWLKYAKDEYEAPEGADYSPLRDRFESFVQFERAIDLVRSTAINSATASKDAYSKYLFPMAPEALFWEVEVKGKPGDQKIDITRNSFTRGGTLLHIMLSRSSSSDELRPLLADILQRESQARCLVRQLQIEESTANDRAGAMTYLPYATHPRFDQLGEDFVRILKLSAPENDKFLWLVTIGALHLSIYHAEVASTEYLGGTAPLDMVCEIVAPTKTVVRQRSIDSLSQNDDFARRAIDVLLKKTFEDPDWKSIVDDMESSIADKVGRACSFLIATLKMPQSSLNEVEDAGDLDAVREKAFEYFRARQARDFARVHTNFGVQAGLVSSRRTNRKRYAPTDQLLQSIVLANIQHEMPMEEFVVILYERYGMIVGPRQGVVLRKAGKIALAKDAEGAPFKRNEIRLEARLRSMGMLRRLSDSQAYVLNPLQPIE